MCAVWGCLDSPFLHLVSRRWRLDADVRFGPDDYLHLSFRLRACPHMPCPQFDRYFVSVIWMVSLRVHLLQVEDGLGNASPRICEDLDSSGTGLLSRMASRHTIERRSPCSELASHNYVHDASQNSGCIGGCWACS